MYTKYINLGLVCIIFSITSDVIAHKRRAKQKTHSVKNPKVAVYTNNWSSEPENYNYEENDSTNGIDARSFLRAILTPEGCGGSESFFKDYETCGLYHQCQRMGDNYIRMSYTCPQGESFDEDNQICSSSQPCSSLPPYPQNQGDLPCERNYDKHANPGDCRYFYTCHWTGSYYTLDHKQCPQEIAGQTKPTLFHEVSKNCEVLPDCFYVGPFPDNVKCTRAAQKFPDPEDCTKYWQCFKVFNQYYPQPKYCASGKWFDPDQNKCVVGECPTENKLPPDWKCDGNGAIHVHPLDCQQFYVCKNCKYSNSEEEWCYDEYQRCPDGQYFDELYKQCTMTSICPQKWVELPDNWECEYEGERNSDPEDCQHYYLCYRCNRPRGWCYTDHYCPEGQTFDDDAMQCVYGRCHSHPPVLPDAWECGSENELNADPTDCSQFYKCVMCPDDYPWCYELMECPEGQLFDDGIKQCVTTEMCPQDQIVLPPGLICEKEGEIRVNPKDCTQFYSCIRCSKPNGWCYELSTCPNGQYFDDEKKICVFSKICPQELKELPNGWDCDYEEEKNQIPANCSEFYTCYQCDKPRGWCYTKDACPKGQSFSEDKMQCVISSRCPQWPPVLPPGWNCGMFDELNVHPTDCTIFYKCIQCPDNKPFCYELEQCPDGEYFDDMKKICVDDDKCPQDKDEIKPGWKCSREGEVNVHPEDCNSFYSCIRCSKPSGWCYEATKCPGGKFFDDVKKRCVNTKVCPQQLIELPPGPEWNCDYEEEKYAFPGNCSEFYVCYRCNKPREWCYVKYPCPKGQTFDNDLMTCVIGRCPQLPKPLPPNLMCDLENELNVDPDDCSRFYRCLKCPDSQLWCYELEQCPKGQVFDDIDKQCVIASSCPQDGTEILPGMECDSEGELHVFPDNCAKFYECYQCNKPKGWCYHDFMCPDGQTFDDKQKKCVFGSCPQDKQVLPPDLECDKDGEFIVFPNDCSKFYQCLRCNQAGGWCYELFSCPNGKFYDDQKKVCVSGSCPQGSGNTDPVWPVCYRHNSMRYYPLNCRQFILCLWQENHWNYQIVSCRTGEIFDDRQGNCIPERGDCPQDLKEIGGIHWTCHYQGELNVYPTDCSKFYKCHTCLAIRGWCYNEIESCPPGHSFYQNRKVCVPGGCDWDFWAVPRLEIRPGWTCAEEGEEHVFPNNCQKYYRCHSCDKPKGWCYDEHECRRNSYYDDREKRCVFGRCRQNPPRTSGTCHQIEEKHAVKENCALYKTCVENRNKAVFYEDICERGKKFEEKIQRCVPGTCPKVIRELPVGNGWKCERNGETHVHPFDCSHFYTCIFDDYDWLYELGKCQDGYIFNELEKKCVPHEDTELVVQVCPNWELKSGIENLWGCYGDNVLAPHPYDCKTYGRCYRCKFSDGWCVKDIEHCSTGSNFDRRQGKCVKGYCTQGRSLSRYVEDDLDNSDESDESSEDYLCTEEGSFKKDYDCQGYWKCWRDNNGDLKATLFQCLDEGTVFDPVSGMCIPGDRC